MTHDLWPKPDFEELRSLSPYFPYVVCTICLAHLESPRHLSSHVLMNHLSESVNYLHARCYFPEDQCPVCGKFVFILSF
jgi:hypothetical protein